jgi:hypothetical protein
MSKNVLLGLRAAPRPPWGGRRGGVLVLEFRTLPNQVTTKKILNHGKSSQLFVSTLFPPPCRRTAWWRYSPFPCAPARRNSTDCPLGFRYSNIDPKEGAWRGLSICTPGFNGRFLWPASSKKLTELLFSRIFSTHFTIERLLGRLTTFHLHVGQDVEFKRAVSRKDLLLRQINQ